MRKTPKSLRLQIGIFGRVNVGKSSFLNMVCGQDFAITSKVPGTTTDVVEKTMELLPVGPVVFLDTAGINDTSELSELRVKKTNKIFDRADTAVLIVEPDIFNDYEQAVIREARVRNIPVVIVVNKTDQKQPGIEFIKKIKNITKKFLLCSSIDKDNRNSYINAFKKHMIDCCPDDFINPLPIIGDLMPEEGLAVLVVPIDFEAPRGRIILPQVQAIRDILDNNQGALIVKEHQYPKFLKKLKKRPDIVVCDSQAILQVYKDTPKEVALTTFSTLFSRRKGDLAEAVKAANTISALKNKDKILIAEACSHHPIEGDIGRVKIPNWLRQYTKKDLQIDTCAGRDWPDNIEKYKVIIHCGGCMITRREMLSRMQKAKNKGVPITNYGVVISLLRGVLEKTLSPFPQALKILKETGETNELKAG